MDTQWIEIVVYLCLINLVAFWAMYSDKKRAKEKAWRIPEKTLFLLVILGGSVGGTLGMILFRHKTRHWYFRWGFPAILIVQILVILFFVGRHFGFIPF